MHKVKCQLDKEGNGMSNAIISRMQDKRIPVKLFHRDSDFRAVHYWQENVIFATLFPRLAESHGFIQSSGSSSAR